MIGRWLSAASPPGNTSAAKSSTTVIKAAACSKDSHPFVLRGLIVAAVVVQICFSLLGLATPWMLKIAIDRILPNADYELFYILCGVMAVIYAMRCIMRYIAGYMGSYTISRLLLDVRNRIFRHLQSLSLRFYDEYRTGKLISNVISDVSLLQQLVSLWISMSDQIFMAATILPPRPARSF